MEEKIKFSKQKHSFNFSPKRKISRLKTLQGNKTDEDIKNFFNLKNLSLKSDNKIINYSDTLTKLLGQIKSKQKKNSSRNNSILDDSFNNSNSSEINDDKDSDEEKDENNISPRKSPKLNRIMTLDSNKNSNVKKNNYKLKFNNIIDKTSLVKLEKSPTLTYNDLFKKKDSLVLKFHRYFFQDGDLEKNNTIIQYNINKIKIDDINQENNSNIDNTEKSLQNETDIFKIKNQVIKLMDKFDEAFTKEKRLLLIQALKDLNIFAKKYKFSYVSQLSVEWFKYLEDKENEKKSLKNFGYYNQIREIMDKMLKEIKKKVNLMILYREKKHLNNKLEEKDENKLINKLSIGSQKKSINKEDLLKSKEIIPIKLDIDIQNKLNLDEIEVIINNLEKGDFGIMETKNTSMTNKKKILKSHFNNRNDNELEAFSYPFKEEDNFCIIF